MHDERDAEDARLLAAGRWDALFAAYWPVVLGRLRAKGLQQDDALDCAQDVMEHLLGELRRGKRYPVPFRVIVHKRTDWTYSRRRATDRVRQERTPLMFGEGWDPPADDDGFGTIEDVYDLEVLLERLPERQADAIRRRYRFGQTPEEIAEDLGITRNAVDQLFWRAHTRLRAIWHG